MMDLSILDNNELVLLGIINEYDKGNGVSAPIIDRLFYDKRLSDGCPVEDLYSVQWMQKVKKLEEIGFINIQGLSNKITKKGREFLEQHKIDQSTLTQILDNSDFSEAFVQLFSFLEEEGFKRTRLHPESNLFYKFHYNRLNVTIDFVYELRENLFDAYIIVQKPNNTSKRISLHSLILQYESSVIDMPLQSTGSDWNTPLKRFSELLKKHLNRILHEAEHGIV